MTTQTKTAHTPGPWRAMYDADGDHAIYRGDTHLATTVGVPQIVPEVDAANALLMAAAPELLEALNVAYLELHEINLANSHGNRPRNPEMTIAAEELAKKLLEKAWSGQ